MVRRRLKTIAKDINENYPGLAAKIVRGYCDTDRKIPGTRLRWPGKGRAGNRLVVTDESGNVVLDHNAAETYRCNEEVEQWLRQWRREHGNTESIS